MGQSSKIWFKPKITAKATREKSKMSIYQLCILNSVFSLTQLNEFKTITLNYFKFM